MMDPGMDPGQGYGPDPEWDDDRGYGRRPPARDERRRSRSNRPRSGMSQTVPAVVLVIVLVVSVIGITRYIAGRTVAQQRQQASTQTTAAASATTAPGATAPGASATTAAGLGPAAPGQATTTTAAGAGGAAPPTTAAGGTGGATGGSPLVGADGTGRGGNLIANAGFEDRLQLQGWTQVSAQAQRVQPGWQSARAVLVRPTPGAAVTVLGIRTKLDRAKGLGTGRTVRATAWVRTLTAGVSARIAVREVAGARTVGADVVTLPLYDTAWHAVQVEHRLRTTTATVDLDIGLAPGQDDSSLLVDAVSASPAA
jgi:hypothetical protein